MTFAARVAGRRRRDGDVRSSLNRSLRNRGAGPLGEADSKTARVAAVEAAFLGAFEGFFVGNDALPLSDFAEPARAAPEARFALRPSQPVQGLFSLAGALWSRFQTSVALKEGPMEFGGLVDGEGKGRPSEETA